MFSPYFLNIYYLLLRNKGLPLFINYHLFIYCICRCSVFLWDKERDELVAKVFDGEIPNDGTGVNGKVGSCSY